MRAYPIVSVVAVNFHQMEVTLAMLKSLHSLNIYTNIEVILVDQEEDGSNYSRYQEICPQIIYKPIQENLGFAGANNLGAKYATGKYLFLLNNDTEVTSDLIITLVDKLEKDPQIGIICPVIRYFYHPDRVQFAGSTLLNFKTGRNRTMISVDKEMPELKWAAYAHGAAMMVPTQLYHQLGGFTESYFLYYEELDFSMKVHNAGYKIMVDQASEVFHKVSVSTGENSPLKTYYHSRNRIQFIRQFATQSDFRWFVIFFTFFSIPKSSIKFLAKFDLANFRSLIRGYWDGLNQKSGKTY